MHFVNKLILLLVLVAAFCSAAACPPGVYKFNKAACTAAAGAGCPVEFVGRGCRRNCVATPQGCPKGTTSRFGDGGCKPALWCGFKCKEKCDKFSRCKWSNGKCSTKVLT